MTAPTVAPSVDTSTPEGMRAWARQTIAVAKIRPYTDDEVKALGRIAARLDARRAQEASSR